MENSGFLKLNWVDFGKGLLVAVIAAFLTGLVQTLESGALPTTAQLRVAGIAAATAGISYLLKNLFQSKEGVPFKKDEEQVKP